MRFGGKVRYIIMRRYSIFHVPVLSFFSKELYKDVGLHWKGVNFFYLFLLLAICLVPRMIKLHIGVTDFVNNYAPTIIEQVPEITISDGQVSIKENQPYYIKEPESGMVLAIIDTTGEIESLEEADAFCLLTGNKLLTKRQFEKRSYDLSKIKHFALMGSYVYRIVQALIYAAIGLLFVSFCKTTLSYASLIRLAVVAVTPCVIVSTILGLGGNSIPAFLYPAAVLVYLFFAVRSISRVPQVHECEGQADEQEETVWDKNSDQ